MNKRQAGDGVRATRIERDETQGPLVYDPGHPDANADGYVERPNINVVAEMVDMITASRAYEANTTTINAAKAMVTKALDMGK
jgi:flagellar basal-body rod protein FlgC